MKRTDKLISIISGAVILSSAVVAFSTEQASMNMDNSKNSSAATVKSVKDSVKLKPQTTCPILGSEINKKLFIDYKGKRIYVCCEGCLADVRKDPEGAIKKLEAKGQSPEIIAPVKTTKPAEKKATTTSDTSMKGMKMSGEMNGMDHSKMK